MLCGKAQVWWANLKQIRKYTTNPKFELGWNLRRCSWPNICQKIIALYLKKK